MATKSVKSVTSRVVKVNDLAGVLPGEVNESFWHELVLECGHHYMTAPRRQPHESKQTSVVCGKCTSDLARAAREMKERAKT